MPDGIYNDVVFQDYEDVWQDADDVWHRGITFDALKGCVFVNPKFAETISLVVSPLMAGALAVSEFLKGVFEVKPYE